VGGDRDGETGKIEELEPSPVAVRREGQSGSRAGTASLPLTPSQASPRRRVSIYSVPSLCLSAVPRPPRRLLVDPYATNCIGL
jgi:hypothetical protein